MFRFLRFEIGGASALLWLLVFISPYLDAEALARVDATKVLAVVFGSITISLPLGNIIHQLSDTLLNPFAPKRLWIWRRDVLALIRRELGTSSASFRDQTYQAILVFSKAQDKKIKPAKVSCSTGEPEKTVEQEVTFRSEVLREEISNRYSYYYARVENGAIAPFFGFGLAEFCKSVLRPTTYIVEVPTFSEWWLLGIAAAIGLVILWRLPQLFRELDDLEAALVLRQRDCWPLL